LERLKTIVEEQQDEGRRQQLEDVEEDAIEPDSAAKVEEPAPSTEPEIEVTEADVVNQSQPEGTDLPRSRLTSLNLGSETSACSPPTDRLTDEYFDLSTSPHDFTAISDRVSALTD
jgi:hypothetical protein